MAALHPGPGAALLGEISARWRAADPLLPQPAALRPGAGCGAVFTLAGAAGQPQAVGACEHWHGEAESLELTWGAAHRFRLEVLAGGEDVAAALDALLGLWRVHLAGVPGADEPDSAAIVTWPSRDVDGVRTLLRPRVRAARRRRRAAGSPPRERLCRQPSTGPRARDAAARRQRQAGRPRRP